MAGAVTVVPPAGASTARESAICPLLEAVQVEEPDPAAATGSVELAPPELDSDTAQREVWALPAVSVELLAPLQATSTIQEFAVPTVADPDSVLPEASVAIAAAAGAFCATPDRDTEPALTPFTAPPKVTVLLRLPVVT